MYPLVNLKTAMKHTNVTPLYCMYICGNLDLQVLTYPEIFLSREKSIHANCKEALNNCILVHVKFTTLFIFSHKVVLNVLLQIIVQLQALVMAVTTVLYSSSTSEITIIIVPVTFERRTIPFIVKYIHEKIAKFESASISAALAEM